MPWALVLAVVTSQAQTAHIKAAREAMAELRYPEAKVLLQKARQQQGLTREELIEIFWMQGLVSASLNQPDNARAAFRTLFAIDPDHKPERDYPPKIMSPYYEARGWIATNKPLDFAAQAPVIEQGHVRRIGVTVRADPLSLVTSVRIHVAGGESTEHDLKDLKATRDVDAETVTWWAELLGERGAQLARLGTREEPLVNTGRLPEPAQSSAVPAVTDASEQPSNPLRLGAYAAAAVGIAALGVGCVFGVRSNNFATALKNRMYDADGVVIGWTQAEAAGFESQMRTEATVANAMFVTAGVLVVAAVVLFILGREP